ncbi:zinc finger CCCH domain-containing protein 13-like [Nilaparvata lugens]|uniref:zinc finger CCCH domain-containing protein 13-like n=1 Tax=Nilaparvata lugens TaxID=108931 RepID=UPI00193DBE3A|nr:zinc finger CCCH domain-containing protein 13-like [Nilaparvata lugens]
MSKVTKRKITVESSISGSSGNLNSNLTKDSQRRQSVFERLGIKTSTPITVNTALSQAAATGTGENYCRHWAQNGTCPYGKSCKFTNTHTLISPSKRVNKKEVESKEQATLRALEEAKRLHSSVLKRSSPDVNWETWDQTDLEYEDEKVLEKRRQLLQRELELQMKREETENSTRKGFRPKHLLRKDASSSSSSSLSSSTSTDSSTSSDDSSSGSTSSPSAVKRKANAKARKSKRDSTSSTSDIDRVSRKKSRDGKKGRSSSSALKKLSGVRRSGGDGKKGSTPPSKGGGGRRKASLSRSRKKSPASPPPTKRLPATPPPPSIGFSFASKSAKGSAKTGSSSRHAASPRSGSRRSMSVERKHNRSLSPRGSNRDRERDRDRGRSRSPKLKNRDRSPTLSRRSGDTSRSRRKESPDVKSRDKRLARKNSPKRDRLDDRKRDDDRSRGGKDDRRFDKKPIPDRSSAGDREKREHEESARIREKAREKERIEALERCRERQRERELMAKDKDKQRDRLRDDRDKDVGKMKDYDREIPLHSIPGERKGPIDRDRLNKDRKDREKDRFDKDREREKPPYERAIEKPRLGPDRIPDRDRNMERPIDKDRRGMERDRGNERDHLMDRNKPPESDRERGPERDRSFDKDRVKMLPARERAEFERDRPHDKDRQFERGNEHERSYERDRSMEKDRNVVRDRGIERIMERERGSMDRSRAGSDGEPIIIIEYLFNLPIEIFSNLQNSVSDFFNAHIRKTFQFLCFYNTSLGIVKANWRDFVERGGRFQNEGAGDRGHFNSPSRGEDPRNMRMQPQFGDDRRRRDPGMRNWDYDEGAKPRDWDYQDNRREWDNRNRMRRPPHPNEPVEGCEENIPEKEPIEQVIAPPADISMKRARDESEGLGQEMKKIRTDEPPPAILEEDLSDISDDPDEILNRDDIEGPGTELDAEMDEMDSKSVHIPTLNQSSMPQTPISTANNSTINDSLEQRLADDRTVDEEGVDNLDFEEISDEELEEEARANKAASRRKAKGLGDALGVDWASLVAETRPKRPDADSDQPGAARRRFEPLRILARIGISLKYAGEKMYNDIQQKAAAEVAKPEEDGDEAEVKEPKPELKLLHPVAGIHSQLRLKHSQRRNLFSGVDMIKRALSARRDIAIRRHLCNLPVKSLEVQQAAGFCQWVV